ncbi:MAG: nitrite/sulfite reductase [Micropruina sp.]
MSTPAPARVRPPRVGRSNGQWLVDGTAPLNANEEFKAEDNPLNVRERIETVYARDGFDSIPNDDLHGRFRWMGLYTQRRQDISGSRTASLGPDELSDRYFMMRVRIDGGAVTTDQLRVIAGISTEFARDTADISDRQNVQLHWIRIEDVPEIWRRLESVGLQTTEACGDCPRVILGSPVAGIAADEIIDPTPVIAQIVETYIGDPELSNLPRKFKSAVTGHPSLDVVHEINDISLVGVVHPELGPGYDLWVGGGLSVAPRLAERLGVFVSEERAAEVWYGVVCRSSGTTATGGCNKAWPVPAGRWGPEKFRQVLQDEYLGYELPDGPAPATPTSPGTTSACTPRRTAGTTSASPPPRRTLLGHPVDPVAELAESVGRGGAVHPAPEAAGAGRAGDESHWPGGRRSRDRPVRRPEFVPPHTMACTGIEFASCVRRHSADTATATIAELETR